MAIASLDIAVTKGKGVLTVDLTKLPDDVYKEALLQGLKVLLNRGASKITKAAYPNEEEMKAAAMAKATEQLEMAYSGKTKLTGGKAKKASGAVMTEARRIAKAMVKDAIKAAGGKVSHYEASEITKAANALLETEQGKEIIAQAETNLKEREKTPISLDITSIISESPKLVAKAEEEKAKKKGQLSAKQAGLPKKRKGDNASPTAN